MHHGNIRGKTAIVIGSTPGISKASAVLFAKEGRQAIGEQVVEEIIAAGGKAEFYRLDYAVTEECTQLIDYMVDTYEKLDILNYNTGVSTLKNPEEGFFEKSTVELWDYVTQANLKNAFFISQKAMPALKKTRGNILFTTSGSGIDPTLSMQAVVYGTLEPNGRLAIVNDPGDPEKHWKRMLPGKSYTPEEIQ